MSAGKLDLVLGGEPRVQLLPPSVREREKRHAARRMMVLLVVLALVISGGGTVFAFLRAVQAETALAAAQQRTEEILAQQQEYAEGSRVAALVNQTRAAQQQVTATEIDWLALLAKLAGYLPEGTTQAEVAFTSPAPWEPPLTTDGPLRAERIASVSLVIVGERYGDAASFIDGVRGMPGYADVVITGTTFEDGIYRTSISLSLNADILADRYGVEQPEGESETDGDAVDAAPAPAPEPTTPTTEDDR